MINHIVIVGPTASGKTALAIDIAKIFDGEIICADSRTVYKEMNIGTAKPTAKEQASAPHHCLDLVYPNQPFTVADFVKAAKKAKKEIELSNKISITVGGSGLYIDAFLYDFSLHPPNQTLRDYYQDWSVESLITELEKKEVPLPKNYKNKRHLLLALERQGRANATKNPLPEDTVIIGLNPPKDVLLDRIIKRSQKMIDDGVVQEVTTLYKKYGQQKAFLGGSYGALVGYINGERTIEEALQDMVSYDKKLAKRQMTWFKRNQDIHWFESSELALIWCEQQLRSTL